jgi:flagellar motility protein MotE (MotC chaperone)
MGFKTQKIRSKGRGTVMVISVLLISSAILRIGGGAGEAVAQALTQPIQPDAIAKPEMPVTATDDPPLAVPLDRKELGSLLNALLEREERVKTLETQIEMRRKALQVADAEINKRLEILEQTEANLRRTLALADGAAEDDLARLTTVYENMKPKDASALFAAMEPDFAAGFLGRMRPDAAAAVMAGLPPDVAYSISVILAGRNAKAPKT